MQLTRHTDYALRLLIDLAGADEGLMQIADIAERQAISRTHLMKIASELAHAGFIEAVRGRGGGLRLARRPAEIRLDEILAVTEPRCDMVDCGSCRLVGRCRLPRVLDDALNAFHAVLARHSLADVIGKDDGAQRAVL